MTTKRAARLRPGDVITHNNRECLIYRTQSQNLGMGGRAYRIDTTEGTYLLMEDDECPIAAQ